MSTKRKTRASESAVETPDSKRRKASERENAEKIQSLGHELLEKLRSARDKRNRLISLEFNELPDQAEVPDYYDLIQLPVAFDTIEEKLSKLQYPSVSALESDLHRLVVNAQTYNEKNSEIYVNADKLKRRIDTFMKQNNPAYSDPQYRAVPTPIPEDGEGTATKSKGNRKQANEQESITVQEATGEDQPDTRGVPKPQNKERRLTLNGPKSESGSGKGNEPPASPVSDTSGTGFEGRSFQEAQEILLDDLLDFTNDEGVEISGPFANLPPRDLRDYYQVIKRPVSLRSIQKKDLADQLALLWHNARQYNEKGSEIYDAAGELEAHFSTRLEQAKQHVQEPAQPKVTLRVSNKDLEPSTKLKLHLTSKSQPTDTLSDASDVHVPEKETSVAPAAEEPLATVDTANEVISVESKAVATTEQPLREVKPETVTSQSSPAPATIQRASGTEDKASPGRTASLGPRTGTSDAVEASPVPSQSPAPPPPPPRDPLETRLRADGKGIADALIHSFVLSAHPSLQEEKPFRMSIPPSEKLSQQSVTINLPPTQRQFRVSAAFPTHLIQRAHRIIMRLNREQLHPIPAQQEGFDPRHRAFDVMLIAGMVNVLELEVLVALTPYGVPKIGTGPEYDYERTTVYLQLSS